MVMINFETNLRLKTTRLYFITLRKFEKKATRNRKRKLLHSLWSSDHNLPAQNLNLDGMVSVDFTCTSGHTIQIEQFCDGAQNCDDGSDEIMTSSDNLKSNESLIK